MSVFMAFRLQLSDFMAYAATASQARSGPGKARQRFYPGLTPSMEQTMTKAIKTFTASVPPVTPGGRNPTGKLTLPGKRATGAKDKVSKAISIDPPATLGTPNAKTPQKVPGAKVSRDQILLVGSPLSTMLNTLEALPAKIGMNWKQIAKRCGLAANSLYNLRGGYCRTLSLQSYIRLSHGLDIPIDELLGNTVKASVSKPHNLVIVRSKAQAGLLQPSPDLPFADHYQLSLPINPLDAAAGAYGVEYRNPGSAKAEDRDTILVAIPLRSAKRRLEAGQLVLIHRTQGDRVEVTSARIVPIGKGIAVQQRVGPGPDDFMLHGIRSDARFLSTKAKQLSVEAIIVARWQNEH
jgi:transcriptional regulator with XRE-family HTH domain